MAQKYKKLICPLITLRAGYKRSGIKSTVVPQSLSKVVKFPIVVSFTPFQFIASYHILNPWLSVNALNSKSHPWLPTRDGERARRSKGYWGITLFQGER